MNIRHVIWDFDGTLFDSYPYLYRAMNDALALHGAHEPETAIAALFMHSEHETIDALSRKYGLGAQLERDYFDIKRRGDLSLVQPYPGAREICIKIQNAGGYNYILTHRDDTAFEIVDLCGMTGLFREIVTSRRGFGRKPDPAGALYLMRRYGMAPGETLVVGDRDIEIALGRNAGVKTCFFSNGTSRAGLTPDYAVTALDDGMLAGIIGC